MSLFLFFHHGFNRSTESNAIQGFATLNHFCIRSFRAIPFVDVIHQQTQLRDFLLAKQDIKREKKI